VIPLEGSAELFVSSEPSGATLFVDGVEKGITGDVIKLQPGTHTLEVRLEGYSPERQIIELIEGRGIQFMPFVLRAAPGGSLQVFSVPSAEVFVDDKLVGVTPLTVSALPGTHQIRLQRPGFEPSISEHLVKANRVSRVGNILLTPQFETMIYWEDAPPLLRLDGIVQTSSYAQVVPGTHSVQLSKDGQDISFSFIMPEKGVFLLDFENQMLTPYSQ
jgi:PEGA domain